MKKENYRLNYIAADLAARLQDASADVQRHVAATGGELAMKETGLREPTVGSALAWLRSTDGRESKWSLAPIVERLDNRYFDLKDRFEAGAATEESYLDAFRKARAAAAVMAALAANPLEAAMDALYEAHAAGVSVDALRKAVEKASC